MSTVIDLLSELQPVMILMVLICVFFIVSFRVFYVFFFFLGVFLHRELWLPVETTTAVSSIKKQTRTYVAFKNKIILTPMPG
jgi:uncharacterized membrane protein